MTTELADLGTTAIELHPDSARYGGWNWTEPRNGEHFRRCSYCGSVNPDDLAAEPAWSPNWADRKYGWPHKFYVDIPNRDPGRQYVTASTNSVTPYGDGWIPVDDLTDEQQRIMTRCHWSRDDGVKFVQFGTHPNHWGKFYTIHLSDPAIQAEVKADIERRSGLRFTFENGTVRWCGCVDGQCRHDGEAATP